VDGDGHKVIYNSGGAQLQAGRGSHDRRQMQVGWVKIGDFRQIAGYMYISKTVQDRRMVSIKVE